MVVAIKDGAGWHIKLSRKGRGFSVFFRVSIFHERKESREEIFEALRKIIILLLCKASVFAKGKIRINFLI